MNTGSYIKKGNYVPGAGALNTKLMVVAEAPGEVEEIHGKPLVGPTGELFNELLKDAGIDRSDIYITNVSKYRPPNNEFSRLHEIGVDINEQISNLWQEIRTVKPNAILALGDKALQATTNKFGIHNYRGSILPSKEGTPKVVATFHPANLLYQKRRTPGAGLFKYSWKYVMIADFKRALEESASPQLVLPQRNLKVARNSLDLFRFLREYESQAIASVDIESINCLPVCVGIAFNKHEAISVPLYSHFGGIKFSDSHTSDLVERWKLLTKFLSDPSKKIIGHNFKYDDEKLFRLGLRPAQGTIFADTLSLEHTLNPELPSKKLSVITSFRTKESYYKDDGKEYRPNIDNADQLFIYNARDCAVTYEVWEDQDKELDELAHDYSPKIKDFYYNYVARLHNFYLEMERTGFRVDPHIRSRLNQKYTAWHNRLQQEFIKLVGRPINVASPKQIFNLVYNELGCPLRKDTGEDTIVQLMTNAVKDDRRKTILSNILEDRRVRKAKGTYIEAELDYDGRLKSSFFITGTETGRSTTNTLDSPIRPKGHSVGLAFQTITKHGDIGADVRRMLVPDEGYVFLSCDLSQAEARVVAVLSEDWELLKAFDTVDIHRRTAGLVFDYVNSIELTTVCSNPLVDKIDKEGGERFLGKKTRHAGNYNMGPERHHADCHSEARRAGIKLDLSEYKARRNLEKFHECSPKIKGVFHNQIQHYINKQRYLINPYGRIRFFLDRVGEEMYREGYAQIPQSTVHDTLTRGALDIKAEGLDIKWLKEDHDALTVMVREREMIEIAKFMKSKIEREIDFSECTLRRKVKLTIPAEFEWSDTNYKNMKGLKLT
jgi:uracil-DNA glycosylase family 4